MSQHAATDQLCTIIDRVLRLKTEQDAITADIKETYAEAKGNGYDKTALGRVIAHLRKIEKNASGQVEADAIFDLYLETYQNAPRVHAYACAGVCEAVACRSREDANVNAVEPRGRGLLA